MMRGRLLFCLLAIASFSGISYSADVLFLFSEYCAKSTLAQFDVGCRFYGLEARKVLIEDNFYYDEDTLWGIIKTENIKALVITADLLELYEIQNAFLQKPVLIEKKIPVLIADITSETDPSLLSVWSDNSILECTASHHPYRGYFAIGKNSSITAQLGGFFLPAKLNQVFQLQLNGKSKSESLVKVSRSLRLQSVFSRMNIYDREVFFLTRIDAVQNYENTNWQYRRSNFFQYAPWMFFLQYACNNSCLQVSDRFANFTIDDPWLIEPYGYFSYRGLLSEMQKNTFHTTIAFIPWNYDRSKKEVIDLIAANPGKFSICIHGNNHDEKEFNEDNLDFGDLIRPNSSSDYESGIKQAIARMERFKELTSLSYDKVMIFPQESLPVKALSILKKYNFVSTVNSSNVPQDSLPGLDPVLRLRAVNNLYENIPGFERYKAEDVSPVDIAIDLFLGNPILLYAHHDFFENGSDRFNLIAKKINRLQPGIKWMSLSELSKRYYLERTITDELVEIYPFSNNIILYNKTGQRRLYNLVKHEDDLKSIRQISIDGKQCNYSVLRDSVSSCSNILIETSVDAGQSYNIIIEYRNSSKRNGTDIAKNDWNVNIIRHISDFRDMSVSTNYFGQMIIGIYYNTGLNRMGIKRGFILILIILSVLIAVIKLLVQIMRKGPEQAEHQKAQLYNSG